VRNASDIETDEFSGIVGLSPGNHSSDIDDSKLPSFIEQLDSYKDKKGNNIVQPIFSFFLSDRENITGKVIFGGYDLAKYAEEGATEYDIKWSNTTKDKEYFWTLHLG
jgi:hypothetical protein